MLLAEVFLALAAVAVGAQADGTFVILHSPENLIFKSKEPLYQSYLKDVFTATLGYTANTRPWNGLHYKDPFKLPEAVVAVVVEGVDSLGLIEGKKFPLIVDESEEFTWQSLSNRLKKRDNNNFPVRIYLGDGLDALGQSALGELKPNSTDAFQLNALSLDVKEDQKFLEELQLLHAIADKVRTVVKADEKSDLYWLVVSGLKPVLDIHGNNSLAAKEALNLLDETLYVVSKAFKKVYNDQVLINAFTNDMQSNIRERRAADDEKEESTTNKVEVNIGAPSRVTDDENTEEKFEKNKENENNHGKQTEDKNGNNTHENPNEHTNITTQTENILSSTEGHDLNFTYFYESSEGAHNENLAATYSEDYPVIFNIILWFMVVFLFSLLAICIFIADMDPGRDSIIYRMTSNRMKKDN